MTDVLPQIGVRTGWYDGTVRCFVQQPTHWESTVGPRRVYDASIDMLEQTALAARAAATAAAAAATAAEAPKAATMHVDAG